ncbi:DUF6157 family protein [Larkinella sp.]|uniref:DUF6157 family protein n=1 Tax=Larkinella sp. TaxID=2034517 RepID=UPI003BA97F49
MKIHTTNYTNTLIAIADDCPASRGETPPQKGDAKSVARLQFEMLSQKPYHYTSDDVLFQVYADRNDLTESERPAARQQFFSKGQPCFRASPLTKRYGWGVHSDENGRIALLGCETEEYDKLASDGNLQVVKAMKSSR